MGRRATIRSVGTVLTRAGLERGRRAPFGREPRPGFLVSGIDDLVIVVSWVTPPLARPPRHGKQVLRSIREREKHLERCATILRAHYLVGPDYDTTYGLEKCLHVYTRGARRAVAA